MLEQGFVFIIISKHKSIHINDLLCIKATTETIASLMVVFNDTA